MDKIQVACTQMVACNKVLQHQVFLIDDVPQDHDYNMSSLISVALGSPGHQSTRVSQAVNLLFPRALDRQHSLGIFGIEASTNLNPMLIMKNDATGTMYRQPMSPLRLSYADDLGQARELFRLLLPRWSYTVRENHVEVHHPYERGRDQYSYAEQPALAFTKATIRAFLMEYGSAKVKSVCQSIQKS